jgi:RsmE family RNA methyltransferase
MIQRTRILRTFIHSSKKKIDTPLGYFSHFIERFIILGFIFSAVKEFFPASFFPANFFPVIFFFFAGAVQFHAAENDSFAGENDSFAGETESFSRENELFSWENGAFSRENKTSAPAENEASVADAAEALGVALFFRGEPCYTFPVNIILFEPHEAGKPLSSRDGRAVHLVKVLHKRAGDSFDAGILGGPLGTGTISSIGEDGTLVYALDLRTEPAPRLPIRMAVGFPRPIQLRRLLRDLSNLGVEAVDLVGSDLGEKSYRKTTLLTGGGARAALIEGAVQARDTLIPALSAYPSLEAWLEEASGAFSGALLVAPDNIRPTGAMADLPIRKLPTVLAIGPERGWSGRERDLLERAGFARLSLGKRALRTETACVAAAVVAIEKYGELR